MGEENRTPVMKGQSRIETEFNQSTREEWNVPCPDCGHYQPFVWANVIFDKDDPQGEVLYKCERCGCENGEYAWKAQEIHGHCPRIYRQHKKTPGRKIWSFNRSSVA